MLLAVRHRTETHQCIHHSIHNERCVASCQLSDVVFYHLSYITGYGVNTVYSLYFTLLYRVFGAISCSHWNKIRVKLQIETAGEWGTISLALIAVNVIRGIVTRFTLVINLTKHGWNQFTYFGWAKGLYKKIKVLFYLPGMLYINNNK